MADTIGHVEQFLVRQPDGVRETAACAECKGRCCRFAPGGFWPDDFVLPMLDTLTACFISGFFAVDWWEGWEDPDGDPRGLFVRPSAREEAGGPTVERPSWGGVCSFLSDSGCVFPLELRPHDCRMLEPEGEAGNGCRSREGYEAKRLCAVAWVPFRETIRQAAANAEAEGLQTPILPVCSLTRKRDPGLEKARMLADIFGFLAAEE